jgi:hypothetical protein
LRAAEGLEEADDEVVEVGADQQCLDLWHFVGAEKVCELGEGQVGYELFSRGSWEED